MVKQQLILYRNRLNPNYDLLSIKFDAKIHLIMIYLSLHHHADEVEQHQLLMFFSLLVLKKHEKNHLLNQFKQYSVGNVLQQFEMLKIMVRLIYSYFIFKKKESLNLATHVIACGEVDKIAFRTINYLRGIVLGKWIVSEKCNANDKYRRNHFISSCFVCRD